MLTSTTRVTRAALTAFISSKEIKCSNIASSILPPEILPSGTEPYRKDEPDTPPRPLRAILPVNLGA